MSKAKNNCYNNYEWNCISWIKHQRTRSQARQCPQSNPRVWIKTNQKNQNKCKLQKSEIVLTGNVISGKVYEGNLLFNDTHFIYGYMASDIL